MTESIIEPRVFNGKTEVVKLKDGPYRIFTDWVGNIGPEQLELCYVEDDRKYSPEAEKLIEKKKEEIAGGESKGWRDGKLLALRGLEEDLDQGRLKLNVAVINFSEYSATHHNQDYAKVWKKNPLALADGLCTTCVISTADGVAPLGFRGGGVISHLRIASTFAGALSVDEAAVFQLRGSGEDGRPVFEAAKNELAEELGLPEDILEHLDLRLLAVARGSDNYVPKLIFSAETDLRSDELTDHFGKSGDDEHQSIFMIGKDPDKIEAFLRNTSSKMLSEAAKVSLSIYAQDLRRS
ncbi:hypothetical protein ACFL0Y_03180 [Patescibacteria group bacterium]